MKWLKKKKAGPKFFEEEPVNVRFDKLVDIVEDLETKADFNKVVGAMESIFQARQKLRGVKTDDGVIDESAKFILHEKEGE